VRILLLAALLLPACTAAPKVKSDEAALARNAHALEAISGDTINTAIAEIEIESAKVVETNTGVASSRN
jgi:hypothetical protein